MPVARTAARRLHFGPGPTPHELRPRVICAHVVGDASDDAFAQYEVESAGPDGERARCRRRFREFIALRITLTRMHLPALPPRRVLGASLSARHLFTRARLLDKWLGSICALEGLRGATELRLFLGLPPLHADSHRAPRAPSTSTSASTSPTPRACALMRAPARSATPSPISPASRPSAFASAATGAEALAKDERPQVLLVRIPAPIAISLFASTALMCILLSTWWTLGALAAAAAALGAALGAIVMATLRANQLPLGAGADASPTANLHFATPRGGFDSPGSVSSADACLDAELDALRAAGEACWEGDSLPAALDDTVYLRALLRKGGTHQRTRFLVSGGLGWDSGAVTGQGNALHWASRKLQAAAGWRQQLLAAHAPASELTHRTAEALLGAPVGARETLISDQGLAEAGAVLRMSGLYWCGCDVEGRPVLWHRSGLTDLRSLGCAGAADERAWARAIGVLFELAIVAERAAREACGAPAPVEGPRVAYVECTDGLSFAKVPLANGYRVARAGLHCLVRGNPERASTIAVAPTLAVNRLLSRLMRPFLPASFAARVKLLSNASAMRDHLRPLLGNDRIPTFFGGAREHAVPRTPSGELDLACMMRRLYEDVLEYHTAGMSSHPPIARRHSKLSSS